MNTLPHSPQRRQLLQAAAALCAAATGPALAQSFPSRPVKLVVPSSPGTSIDSTARVFADPLSRLLDTPVVVENRTGAGGLLAYTAVMRAAPDGYTILMSGLPLYLLPLLSEGTSAFDPVKDFTPITRVARAPLAIVVPTDSPYRTLADLVRAMKASDKLTYSSMGVGSSAHLCAVMLNDASRTKASHIAFKETNAALTDVAAGRIAFTCQGSASVLPLLQAGRIRALAVTSGKRWESLPDVPTAMESGVHGLELWPGLDFLGPAGMPPAVVAALSAAFMQVGRTPAYKEFCDKQSLSLDLLPSAVLKDLVPREAAGWKRIAALARNS